MAGKLQQAGQKMAQAGQHMAEQVQQVAEQASKDGYISTPKVTSIVIWRNIRDSVEQTLMERISGHSNICLSAVIRHAC